ncbi:hypothetical protein [Candidatus Ichthyocystis sparus]|uniref:hypothetical protein n=1 Tax=Candidatus Ichthyocystis sparus TaxID=1561004 RepID=UPI000B87C1B8|nr:hypothetical protein [Candidatus Ichthyocystis sparus]
MEQNKYNALKSYNDLLEELSLDEQINLLPKILVDISIEGESVLFPAMERGYFNCINDFGLLLDRLMSIREHIPNIDMANIIFRLLSCKNNIGTSGLFIALEGGYCRTVTAFGNLVGKFALLKHSVPEDLFDSMMLDILVAMTDGNVPGIFVLIIINNNDAIDCYCSLLAYASKSVRRKIFSIKDCNGLPIINAIAIAAHHDKSKSLKSCSHFLKALSYDEQIDLLPDIHINF